MQSATSLSLLFPLPPCQVLPSTTLPLTLSPLTRQVVEQSLRKSQQPRASQIKQEILARRSFFRHGFHPLRHILAKLSRVVKPCLLSTGETIWEIHRKYLSADVALLFLPVSADLSLQLQEFTALCSDEASYSLNFLQPVDLSCQRRIIAGTR